MACIREIGVFAVAGLLTGALLSGPPAVSAQTPERSVQPDREDAEKLYRKARSVEATDERSMQLTAAWLYRESARFWPKGHEKRYRSLWRAAHLYLHQGRATHAAALLTAAGRQARRNDRPERAATCYLRVARLAAERGDEARARRALHEVRPLLGRDRLDREERRQLMAMEANVRAMITELAESSSR